MLWVSTLKGEKKKERKLRRSNKNKRTVQRRFTRAGEDGGSYVSVRRIGMFKLSAYDFSHLRFASLFLAVMDPNIN